MLVLIVDLSQPSALSQLSQEYFSLYKGVLNGPHFNQKLSLYTLAQEGATYGPRATSGPRGPIL